MTGALVLAPGWPDGDRAVPAPAPRLATSVTSVGSVSWEHSYRVSGKVWILFWVGRDNVGTARMTRRTAAASSTISFIGGSDPKRAPGNLNQWGVAIEEADGDRTKVFVAKTIAPDDLTAPERRLVEGPAEAIFGAGCASIESHTSRSSVTGVRVDPAMTFRSMPVLLDLLGTSRQWEATHAEQPADAYPGFFSAMLAGIDQAVSRAHRGILAPAVARRTYLFKGLLYDIYFRKIEPAGPGLLREKFTYRNRTTGDSADFSITFGIEGAMAGVPVAMTFQPSWWMQVHLRLDDTADVPDDPSQDASLASRIDSLCTTALKGRIEGTDD